MVDVAQKSSFWKNRRVLVTGGSGFIGYALARTLLQKGARVTILDIRRLPAYSTAAEKKKFHFVRGSVVSAKLVRSVLKKDRIQTVFHLAAEAIVGRAHADPAAALETNVLGTWVVMESARALPVQEIVIASSDKAYGSHKKLPYKESAPLTGKNPYDVSKSAADLIATMYGKTYDLPVAIARCGNVYGPGDLNWSRLIPDAFRSAHSGRALEIRSDGTYKRDYVYVGDVVNAYMTLAARVAKNKLHGEAFNFGNDKPLRVSDVLKELSRVAPKFKFHIRNTARHEIRHQYLDSSKARRVLGWRARTNIRDGMREAAAWYGKYFARPKV